MIQISDRALVRFLQRSGAIDVEQMRALISGALERSRKVAELAGGGDFVVIADGLRYVIEDGVLVTVLDATMRGRRR